MIEDIAKFAFRVVVLATVAAVGLGVTAADRAASLREIDALAFRPR